MGKARERRNESTRFTAIFSKIHVKTAVGISEKSRFFARWRVAESQRSDAGRHASCSCKQRDPYIRMR